MSVGGTIEITGRAFDGWSETKQNVACQGEESS